MSDRKLVNASIQANLLDTNFLALRNLIHESIAGKLKELDAGIGKGFALWRIEFAGVVYRLELTPHGDMNAERH